MKKYVILFMLLLSIACNAHKHCPPDQGYTVMFLPDLNKMDTTYLLNRKSISYKEAEKIANDYPGQARPILYDSVWGKYTKKS